jgi:predicted Zn-dependent protease
MIPLLIGGAVGTACSTNTEGRKQLVLMSSEEMNRMGEEAYAEMRSKEKISTNQALTDVVVAIGKRIAAASTVDFDWEFTLFDSEAVNAFCLPGGKIGVYTGILPIAKNNAGLAAIMGHEVAHAIAQHSNERVSQQLILVGGLTVAGIALEDNEYKDEIMGGLGLGAQFGVVLPFSRSHEAEADKIGLRYMAKAGYDPNEASKLWLRMNEASGGGPPEILSTHPDPVNRANDLASQVPEVMKYYNASVKQPTKSL